MRDLSTMTPIRASEHEIKENRMNSERLPKDIDVDLPLYLSIDSDEYERKCDEYEGICIKCGRWRENVEPDAEKYECYDCGENAVYGAEQAVLLELLQID